MTKTEYSVILFPHFSREAMPMKEFIMSNIFICAVAGDLWDYKIRNPVIIAGWITAVCLNTVANGFYGILNTIFCIIITILIGFPVFMTGGIGAGDIKLMSVIGGMYGLAFLAKVAMLFLIMAGAVSLVKLIRKRTLILRIKAFIYYLLHIRDAGSRYYCMKRDGSEFAICLAPVMAAAYFITLFF